MPPRQAAIRRCGPTAPPSPYPASVINFSSGSDTSNSAIVTVGSDGKIDVYNSRGTVGLVVYVNGYFTSAARAIFPGGYVPVTQTRIADTRDGTGAPQSKIPPGGTLNVQIDGVAGITDEASVYANITIPSPGAAGNLYAYATGGSAGQPVADYKSVTTSDGAVVAVGTNGEITVKNGSSMQSIDVVIGVYGYSTAPPTGGGVFTAVQDRLLDPRSSCCRGPLRPVLQGRSPRPGSPTHGRPGLPGWASRAPAVVACRTAC
jgi:hypothetical protein